MLVLLLCAVQQQCSKNVRISTENRVLFRELRAGYKSSNWEVRLASVKKMASVEHPDKDDFFLETLNDSHSLVRIEAIKGLSKSESSKVRRRIRSLAEYEENVSIRWYALKTLSTFQDATSAPVFVKGLNSEDWIIREECIKGLLAIEDFAVKYVSIPYIIQALEDKNLNVRITTMNSLKIKDRRIYAVLIEMINGRIDRQYGLLIALLKAIHGYRLDPEVKERISDLLTHSNPEVRINALRVLKKDIELEEKEGKGE